MNYVDQKETGQRQERQSNHHTSPTYHQNFLKGIEGEGPLALVEEEDRLIPSTRRGHCEVAERLEDHVARLFGGISDRSVRGSCHSGLHLVTFDVNVVVQ